MPKKKLEIKKQKKAKAKYQEKLQKRAIHDKQQKEERQKAALERIHDNGGHTIKNEVLVANPEVLARIEHNLSVLKALEDEWIKEQRAKENLNEELEREGFKSLDEKWDALKRKSEELAEQTENKIHNKLGIKT